MDRALREALAEADDRHWWFEGRRRILASILRSVGAEGPLLEVGCGSGANLNMLRAFGPVTGIEPDQEDRERAASRGNVVLEGSLPDLPVEPASFRTVLALDVIEHIDRDQEAVAGLARVCSPDGTLVLTVPAMPWLWSAHDERNGHFRRYTRTGLRSVLERAGLRVERLTYFNSLLLPAVAGVRVMGRLLGLDAAGTGVPPQPVNKALMKLLASESRLLAAFDLPAGVSLLAVARPNPRHPVP